MMWSSDICFLFLFERTQRPAFEGAHGKRKWSSEEYTRSYIGDRPMTYADYKDCYSANVQFAPKRHHLRSFDPEYGNRVFAHTIDWDDVHIRTDVKWFYHANGEFTLPPDRIDISLVVYHELLHTIGLHHDETSERSLMYPTTTGSGMDMSQYTFSDNEREQLLARFGRLSDTSCPYMGRSFENISLPKCRPRMLNTHTI